LTMTIPAPNIVVILLAGLGLGALGALQWSYRRDKLLRLRVVMGDSNEPRGEIVSLLEWLGTHIPGASDDSLRTLLIDAGLFQPVALPLFVALRLVSTATVILLVLFHKSAVSPVSLMSAVFLAFFTSRLFVILIKLRAESRHNGIRRELPPLVDLLLMVLNSGVSIDQCLRYVTVMLKPTAPLTAIVFDRYVTDIDNGVPYEAALERLGQRLGIDEGHDLTNLIKQALLHGGEIMTALERFGSELADQRVAAAREQIGRKAVLLTVIMLFFFMPVLLITLAGPAVSNITETLKTVQQQIHDRKARP
jgi:tight adherence protein C